MNFEEYKAAYFQRDPQDQKFPLKGMRAASLSLASYELMAIQQQRISIPKRFTIPMREMLALQPRFDVRRGKMNLRIEIEPWLQAGAGIEKTRVADQERISAFLGLP